MATIQQARVTVLGTVPMTAEQLLEMDAKGMRGELIRGVFCPTMAAGVEHGEIVMRLGRWIGNAVAESKSGRVMGSDSGVKIESDPDTVREPDIAYFSKERLPLGVVVRGYADVPPNLVVEVVSPSDSVREVSGKAHMWINSGVQLVWVIWPDTKIVEIYKPNRPTVSLGEDDTLSGEDILPNLTVRVTDIFEE